jgi:SAM-dependent methyltransferase
MFQCHLCSGRDAIVRARIAEYEILECAGCGLQSTFPFPSRDLLRALYAEAYYGGPSAARFRLKPLQKVVRLFRWRRARMLKRRLNVVGGRRIIDVGCGRGDMIGWLQRWGADVYGTEVSPAAAGVAAGLIGSHRIFVGELADATYPSASFDCVTLWHVLEHVREPDALLREIARVLRPGGFAYIEVPNAAGWSARRFGQSWLAYDVPKHLFHFSPETLKTFARNAGLTCVRESHFSLEYSPVTLLQTLMTASVGGGAVLFRRLTTEGDTRNRTGPDVPRLVLQLLAAGVFAFPALLASGVLSWWNTGDTLGAYFEHTA